ncbi:unnamed protein product [Penicillium salamii]|uniref:Glycylpeptide N-tetradecanoyltransferase n=1 Tax=Penicillium salamii TaxID=1612424 RepID=A0A9W4JDM4_9EURO|nr:unnamed protein product [Penicillium salamii]CAG8176552.1 unnamed protein product [Penicillium salamii]CAG8261772.1 unnamed protein product [Penicillium salamii]CAG8336141.1 unnamed protein product [Penicillium salamii]CAG8358110.1 unnamed protein product [Penicillium salamii]
MSDDKGKAPKRTEDESSGKDGKKIPPQLATLLLDQNPALKQELANMDKDQAAALLHNMDLSQMLTGLSMGGKNQKDMASYKFWQTQPVPAFNDAANKQIEQGPIKIIDPEKVSQTPGALIDGFEWCTLDLTNAEELKELYELLNNHYVEDDNAMFRFSYSESFLHWALMSPGWKKEWHVGVRATKSRKLVASICGVPTELRVRGERIKVTEINFLCIHKKLRSKRLTPVLIKEITRRCYVNGIYQAIYTGGVILPTPVSSCRYYHRALDWLKLYEVGFSPLPHGSTKARMITKNHLPTETLTPGLRPMEVKDIDAVYDLLERYMRRFDMNQAFTREEIDHWLVYKEQPDKEQVVWSYVVEDPETHKITDFVSFYNLSSTVIDHPKHEAVRAAYLYYYASETAFSDDQKAFKERLQLLMNDALICAKKAHFDVFNALTSHDNPLFLEQLKFGAGDGQLHFYLYNYRAAPIAGGINQKNLPDESKMGGVEELSYMLAERFATKCFTPLELTHFKDNFYSRASEQGGLRYWNEKTLSGFLGIPDGIHASQEQPLDAGPVIFRMVSYLGAFPFQNTLAPSVLTFEAMVKVVVLLTERYGKALKRGHKDRIKLLFGSLADVGRKLPSPAEAEGATAKEVDATAGNSHAPGFSIDEPANDEYDEDEDDDLALAALESLDAIEVFKHDHRVDKTVYETRISIDTFRRLLMLLLVIAPLKPLESLKVYTSDLDTARMEAIQHEADSIIAAFSPEENDGGISYKAFARTVSTSLPYLFDPLTALFEHMLFSKNLDLSQHRQSGHATEAETETEGETEKIEPIPPPTTIMLPGSFESTILTPTLTSHLSLFLPSSPNLNLFRSGVKLHPVFSTNAHGSSLSSFSHHVLTWQSATLLILQGSPSDSSNEELTTLGAYLPQAWKTTSSSTTPDLPCLFQLSPKHILLPGNPSPSIKKPNTPPAYFSPTTGIALGCQIPAKSHTQQNTPKPLGAGSLLIDGNLETVEFHTAPVGHDGVFLPSTSDSPAKTKLDLYTLEIWGIVPNPEGCEASSAVEMQRAKWEFEARDAERRRNINFGSAGADQGANENARWLLEAAGVIGDSRR